MSIVRKLILIIGSICVVIAAPKIILGDLPLILITAARYGDTAYALIFAVSMFIVCLAAFAAVLVLIRICVFRALNIYEYSVCDKHGIFYSNGDRSAENTQKYESKKKSRFRE